jgi:PHD/YefM family antitoxin component YafN of YafNO toxin-antitoxin module
MVVADRARRETTMTSLAQPTRYLVDDQGQRTAVVVDLEYWEALMDLLEDLEDLSMVQEMLARLEAGPEASGALRWDDVRDDP